MNKPYDYHVIENLNLNIRVTKEKVYKDENNLELFRDTIIEYNQAILDHSDMEDILERANAMANNVTIFNRKQSKTPNLTPLQISECREEIGNAIKVLIDNLTNKDFVKKHVKLLQKKTNESPAINELKHKTIDGNIETTITLMYTPEILSKELIYPIRPGAIINNFEILDF